MNFGACRDVIRERRAPRSSIKATSRWLEKPVLARDQDEGRHKVSSILLSAPPAPEEDAVRCRSFRTAEGGGEHFLIIKVPADMEFMGQIDFIRTAYRKALKSLDLDPATAVFRRIFLSDILNQVEIVRQSDLVDTLTAISIVQQSPLMPSKIALLAYHVDSTRPVRKHRVSPGHILVEKGGYRHLWSTQLCSCEDEATTSPGAQTTEVFNNLVGTLKSFGATLRDHCIRTWIYINGVDAFYGPVVDSRRKLFAEQGLTNETHYIASTGIEGACSHRFDLVAMDAYSNLDLVPGQMSYLNDFGQLCPTKDYNVTFERGTRITYADRAHCFISGTASIDRHGQVVHVGDAVGQLKRALDNVNALLRAGSATLADMMYLIIYLRDAHDTLRVESYLRRHLPFLPTLVVQGAVCRPAWLVEVEGIAITKNHAPSLLAF